ncbi:acyl carrier protein [Streptomyces sp. GKU 257-1]|nr:acyl carrier protein [Streptomyces sp. GKU 257-1]
MPADDIDPEEDFDSYGVDSLIVMSATTALEEHFGPLSKTLFFEYVTLGELADHFAAEHAGALAAALGDDGVAQAPAAAAPSEPPATAAAPGTPAVAEAPNTPAGTADPAAPAPAPVPVPAPPQPPPTPPRARTRTSRSPGSPGAIRRPRTCGSSGRTCAPAATASRRCPPTAGTTTAGTTPSPVHRAAPRPAPADSCATSTSSTRCSSGCPRSRPGIWTRRSGSSWRPSGTCWRTPAAPAPTWRPSAPACSSA